ncbi:hypothetical protein FVEN_g5670 [Fusarium venenatum]|nr:hypothetical protein FVEN_g5670 [Fusarium venenatum]
MPSKDYPPTPINEAGPEVIWTSTPEEFGHHFTETSREAIVCYRCPPPLDSIISVQFRISETRQNVSLPELLKIKPGMSKFARIALVVELARAVFQFYKTGFLPRDLKSSSFAFISDSQKIVLGDLILYAEAPTFGDADRYYTRERNAERLYGTSFNRVSIMLGIILVEVLLAQEIFPDDEETDVALLEARQSALDLIGTIAVEWGQVCSDAVRQCLLGVWSISDEELEQVRFIDHVLRPLDQTLRSSSTEYAAPNAKIFLVSYPDLPPHAFKDHVFPREVTDQCFQASPLNDPTALWELIDYTVSMRKAIETIPWLDEKLSSEARGLDEVLQQLDQLSQSVVPESPISKRIEALIQDCLRGIMTIPQIYKLEVEGHKVLSHQGLDELQIQLRVGTLELLDILAGLKVPSSPTLTAGHPASDVDSIFDGAFTLSSRTSVSGGNDLDLQYVDSTGLAKEIIRNLSSILRPKPLAVSRLVVSDEELSSNLHQILEDYCAEIQSTHRLDAPFPQPSQSPFYLKAHSMVLKEMGFIIQQLILISQGETDPAITSLPFDSMARAEDTEVEVVPAFVVLDFLVGGMAFGRLRLRMRRLVEQDTMQIISDEVLRSLPLATPGLYCAIFHIRWDLYDFLENELDGLVDISQVLLLTGGGLNAYASRCADYLKWLWEDSKYDICSHIQDYLEENTYGKLSCYLSVTFYYLSAVSGVEHPDATLMIDQHKEGQPGITVTVVGARETITAVAQQLSWLTAAFRSSPSGPALSDVDFIATEGMQFFIQPGAITNISKTNTGNDTCWYRLVENAVIAHGFPIPLRSDQVGLELPFTVLLKLSRASSFLVANQRLAFYGFSTFLFPTKQCSDPDDTHGQSRKSIQWHFETSDEHCQYLDCANYLGASRSTWSNTIDQRNLVTARHFVGFCRVAEIRLATSNSNFTALQESPLPEASTAVGARIENVTLGTGGLGFATAEFESSIKYAHSIISPVGPDEYMGTLDTIKRMSMILWDSGDQCGWLVPAQALLLHMAHVWVQAHGIADTIRFAKEDNSYLDDVDDILRRDRKRVLRAEGRDDDTDFELRHLIMRLWNDIRGCMLAQQSAIRDDQGVIGYQSSAISGWELHDFITRPPLEFSMKQDKRGPSDDSWKALAAEKNIPVLFCQGAGDIIRTAASHNLCTNCRLPVRQECHLVASLACLGYMAQRYGGFRTWTKLTTEWGWHPTNEVTLFREQCQDPVGSTCCDRLQRLIFVKDGQQGTNLALPATGAVVFSKRASEATGLSVTAVGQLLSGPALATTPTIALGKRGKLKKWWSEMGNKK